MRYVHSFKSSPFKTKFTAINCRSSEEFLAKLPAESSMSFETMTFTQGEKLRLELRKKEGLFSGEFQIKTVINSPHFPRLRSEIIKFSEADLTELAFFTDRFFGSEESV